jgi:hypothetical protein
MVVTRLKVLERNVGEKPKGAGAWKRRFDIDRVVDWAQSINDPPDLLGEQVEGVIQTHGSASRWRIGAVDHRYIPEELRPEPGEQLIAAYGRDGMLSVMWIDDQQLTITFVRSHAMLAILTALQNISGSVS